MGYQFNPFTGNFDQTGGGGSQVQTDWNATSGIASILNKPSTFAPSAHASSHASGGSDALTLAASQITGLASVATSGAYSSLSGRPSLATVATTGKANDLIGTSLSLSADNYYSSSFLQTTGNGTLYFGCGDGTNNNTPLTLNVGTAGFNVPTSIANATANTSALTATYSVTGANTTALLNLSGTWNTTGVATGLKLNITDTASNASSLLADLGTGSRTQYAFTKARQFWLYNSSPATQDASNYERGFFRWNSNVLEIGTEAGGTGTARNLFLLSAGGNISTSAQFQSNYTTGLNDAINVAFKCAFGQYGVISFAGGGWTWKNNASQYNTGTADLGFTRNAAGILEVNNGTGGTFRDIKVRNLIQASGIGITVTPANNGDLEIEQTSNTSITFKMKGTDGTVRSAVLALV